MPWPRGHPSSSLTGQSVVKAPGISSFGSWRGRGLALSKMLCLFPNLAPPTHTHKSTGRERSRLLNIVALINSFAVHGGASQTCLRGGIPWGACEMPPAL